MIESSNLYMKPSHSVITFRQLFVGVRHFSLVADVDIFKYQPAFLTDY